MNHLSEEQLVLHYYGEGEDSLESERHLEECSACREQYAGVQRVLNVVDSMPAPARGPEYGAAVWRRIEGNVGRRRWRSAGFPVWRWAWAGAAMAALLTVAFLAGRFYPQPRSANLASNRQVRQEVLLLAVGDYLERSQMVLVELANARPSGPLDITSEQERVRDLVTETRLYRQTAASTGANEVSGLLDELERVLVDIAHGPSSLTPEELGRLRQRLESEGIIFKIRVVNSNVRSVDDEPAQPAEAGHRL